MGSGRGQAGDVTPSVWAGAIGRTKGRHRHPHATATFSTSGLTAVLSDGFPSCYHVSGGQKKV